MNTRETNFWEGRQLPRISPEHFNEIIATASDLAIMLTLDGTIEAVVVNPLNQTIGKLDHWVGRSVTDFLTTDSHDRLLGILKEYRSGMGQLHKYVEINHFDNANWDFPIRYTFHLTGVDNQILMLGRDLRPVAELQQRLIKAQLSLEQDYENRRDYETRYRVLMETSRDALIMVNATTGRITDLNTSAATILGSEADALTGNSLGAEFDAGNKGDFLDGLMVAAANEGATSVQTNTKTSRRSVEIFPTLFRAAGDRTLLCRLETQHGSEGVAAALSENLGVMYRDGADAVIFTDERGVINSGNDAFMNLIDAANTKDVIGRTLGDFLTRGNVDMNVLLENAKRAGTMRIYATRLVSRHGSQIPVEISATHLTDLSSARFAFIIRDAARSEVVRETQAPGTGQDKMRDVVDLVGSSPLKDIVAATTDVIEKLCIETAVELTGNNRVAAAEMLGLSRQSLYVKLRKYEILEKPGKD